MKLDEIKLMYEYNYWANKRIWETCEKVTEEQYTATTPFGNLRDTVIHIVDAEWTWRTGFQSFFVPREVLEANPEMPAPSVWQGDELTSKDLPTLDALKERAALEEREMRAYFDGLIDQDLNGYVRYSIPEGYVRERRLWQCLVHVVNHGTQHRSEAAALLTSYGASPGEMDFTRFMNIFYNLPE